ncbi:hypothetical protein E2C01_050314 [Portunus trituberculatus]|uniref:Uncharacterized protein n=1 Tax=Portunus trituberculatus TaxID=210409 RepID=A0A5B7GGE6_PORTR|nr:hypothetical protein [Portunus trituberculatus]
MAECILMCVLCGANSGSMYPESFTLPDRSSGPGGAEAGCVLESVSVGTARLSQTDVWKVLVLCLKHPHSYYITLDCSMSTGNVLNATVLSDSLHSVLRLER